MGRVASSPRQQRVPGAGRGRDLGGPGAGDLRELFDAGPFIERLLDQLLVLVPAAEASSIGLVEDDGRIVFTHASSRLVAFVGVSVDVRASLSGQAMASGKVLCCDDAVTDPRVDRSLMGRIAMRTQIVVPLLREGVAFGVVHVLSSRPAAFTDQDVARCRALVAVVPRIIDGSAELARLAEVLGPGSGEQSELAEDHGDALAHFVAQVLRPEAVARLEARRRILEVLGARSFRVAYQPVVDLSSDQIVYFEALARFRSGPPERYFTDAADAGLGVELELAVVETALQVVEVLPETIGLALNVGPDALASDGLADLLGGGRGRRVALELTEHAPVADYAVLEEALVRLRSLGAKLSVDDTGAGFASLSHIVRLSPECIKIDRWIIAGVAADRVRRSLIAALVGFAHDLGAKVVGEGIETTDERRILEDLGVDFGQGYLLGRPGPLAGHLRTGPRAPRSEPAPPFRVPGPTP